MCTGCVNIQNNIVHPLCIKLYCLYIGTSQPSAGTAKAWIRVIYISENRIWENKINGKNVYVYTRSAIQYSIVAAFNVAVAPTTITTLSVPMPNCRLFIQCEAQQQRKQRAEYARRIHTKV